MEVIPAIDLLDGACVRLRQGDYGQVTRFSDDPVAMARQWQQLGAQRLHLVDLDGARRGEPSNDATIKAIASTVEIPVQLGGGVRSVERAKDLLACGVDRVILGTAALENPQLVRRLAQAHPGRIAVGIDARNGLVATRGWLHQSPMEAIGLAASLDGSGVVVIISTDIATDGAMEGPNLAALQAMARASTIPVVASGGVANLADVQALQALRPPLAGVIIGRALYDGRVALPAALQIVAGESS
ncbi:MAG: 1-(5-phosphoribosyl)-5-[(5-phosphoribosylamino)methylideneamino]imidazole-4-carboxamide isomerase [Synechococcus sp. SB0668_bin_15]|nr:1-(5-phosphoribosyl)-5-[(5-phosphoribosylamino)methylideneamino]imidazole-4-carboxamide isomerase [Synechococcus sp. SB0668_bin_15]MYA90518.1 1-(5-phosphoribosyl)-5-[(5-phosphoribosylamino)methylideneamino]imidazole-4-carboxamide isomerase [Synechococcus sp. SB0663_bin_10]MYC50205.1 1-(5-phosphoribosyl)-5-[(5-phosphoribosylamino)methylideneamino]imidazole-4-carboxamide isomerase [Synechococcus sp. SB0662_bin_14]MYG45856.1 1-(5-phosphoribosyl)-5-[(5-phosphoribosylamino)methylideneamino]imidazo